LATRDELYRQFGPLLTEAITLLLLEHINLLRQEQGMPEITEQHLLDTLSNHITALPDYDWMTGP